MDMFKFTTKLNSRIVKECIHTIYVNPTMLTEPVILTLDRGKCAVENVFKEKNPTELSIDMYSIEGPTEYLNTKGIGVGYEPDPELHYLQKDYDHSWPNSVKKQKCHFRVGSNRIKLGVGGILIPPIEGRMTPLLVNTIDLNSGKVYIKLYSDAYIVAMDWDWYDMTGEVLAKEFYMQHRTFEEWLRIIAVDKYNPTQDDASTTLQALYSK